MTTQKRRPQTAGTTVNLGNLAIAVLQLEATPATARRRYMALAGRGRTALPEVSDARVSRSGQGTTFIIIPEAPLLPLVAVLTGADA